MSPKNIRTQITWRRIYNFILKNYNYQNNFISFHYWYFRYDIWLLKVGCISLIEWVIYVYQSITSTKSISRHYHWYYEHAYISLIFITVRCRSDAFIYQVVAAVGDIFIFYSAPLPDCQRIRVRYKHACNDITLSLPILYIMRYEDRLIFHFLHIGLYQPV